MSKLQKNQFKDESITTQQVENLQITDIDISDTANIAQTKVQDLSASLLGKVDYTGDLMTGSLVLSENALVPTELASKQYVDDSVPVILAISSIYPVIFINTTQASIGYHYLVHLNSSIQTSNTNTTLTFISANIESGAAPLANTDYFLYATGSGFIWSTTSPTKYKIHPTQNWIYLAWSVTNSSKQLLPLRKHGNQVLFSTRQVIYTTNLAPTLIPINVRPLIAPLDNVQADISIYLFFSGNLQGQTSLFSNAAQSIPTATFSYFGHNGSQSCYTYNTPRSVIPLDSSYNFYLTKLNTSGSVPITVYINGFVEN